MKWSFRIKIEKTIYFCFRSMGPLVVNLKRLQKEPIRLRGSLDAQALEIETLDELIQIAGPARYSFVVQWTGQGIMISGELEMPLRCICARCLTEFDDWIRLPAWTTYAELSGEDALPVEGENVDLTPLVREELIFALPQHPLCSPECPGILPKEEDVPRPSGSASNVWSILDSLDL